MGGYGRRWIPPGSFGEDTSNVGVGHVFVSHDHGEHFTNISGNLPDIAASWTAVHGKRLVVGTDLGVFYASAPGSTSYSTLGHGLPASSVFTVRVSPGDPNLLLVSTYGRGDWQYDFSPPAGGGNAGGPGAGGHGGTFSHGGPRCPKPSGRILGQRVGPLRLGMKRTQARHKLRLFNVTYNQFDDFCLRGGWGIRAGYPSRVLQRQLSRRLRRLVRGRIVIALTANPFYSEAGVRPGQPILKLLRVLTGTPQVYTIGLNQWYVIPRPRAAWVLKVRHGVVQEVGLADKRLTRGSRAALRFMTSFKPG